jgi:mannose-1-phosphate guanylyltransferase
LKALLLAAGLGTRLRPVTDNVPKCLVPIHGRPLLDYWLQMLHDAGVGPLLLNLHHMADQVQEHLRQSPFSPMVSPVYEAELLGTAGTLLSNRDFFAGEACMLIHADNLSLFDVKAFLRRHRERPRGCEITMMTFDTDAPQSCGIVELDTDGVVQAFHEKQSDPPGNLANGAVYLLEPGVLEYLASLNKATIDFSTEVLPRYLGRICAFKNDRYHRDIGTVASYQKALSETEPAPGNAARFAVSAG